MSGEGKNPVMLGGIFKDFQERVLAAETKQKYAEERLSIIIEENRALKEEKSSLISKFKESIASLTMTETHNMEAIQIIEQIKNEKDDIHERLKETLCQKSWLQNRLKELEIEVVEKTAQLKISNDKLELSQNELREEITLGAKFQEQMVELQGKKDEFYKKYVEQQSSNHILMHSLTSKDKQIQLLMKERDRWRDEVFKNRKNNNTNSIKDNKLAFTPVTMNITKSKSSLQKDKNDEKMKEICEEVKKSLILHSEELLGIDDKLGQDKSNPWTNKPTSDNKENEKDAINEDNTRKNPKKKTKIVFEKSKKVSRFSLNANTENKTKMTKKVNSPSF